MKRFYKYFFVILMIFSFNKVFAFPGMTLKPQNAPDSAFTPESVFPRPQNPAVNPAPGTKPAPAPGPDFHPEPAPDFHPEPPENERDFRNLHGKRFPWEDEKHDFSAVYIKTKEIRKDFVIEVYFNEPVDTTSVNGSCFLINGEPLKVEIFRFSKNRDCVSFTIPENSEIFEDDSFNLTVLNIKSIYGTFMEACEIEKCSMNKDYRYFEREGKWKKS